MGVPGRFFFTGGTPVAGVCAMAILAMLEHGQDAHKR
jgi:hypothetical protein